MKKINFKNKFYFLSKYKTIQTSILCYQIDFSIEKSTVEL